MFIQYDTQYDNHALSYIDSKPGHVHSLSYIDSKPDHVHSVWYTMPYPT